MGKLGLVLEGGGMRGVYTAGVLDFLMEKNIYADGVIGVSAGACHACSYASKQIGRNLKVTTKYIRDKRYMSLRSLMKTGDLFGADFIYNRIPNELELYDYEAYEQQGMSVYAVCSNLETGEAEYLKCKDMKKDVMYVRASASLPLLSRIVEVDGKKLLDGGATDSIPFLKFQEMGYDKNIVVLTRDALYRKGKNNLLPMIRKRYKQYPKFVEALEIRHIRYNESLEELAKQEKEGKILVIRPSKPIQIGRLEKDPVKLTNLYKEGYHDAKMMYQDILCYLNKKS